MTAEEVIQKTRYPNIDLIAAASNLPDINLAILQNKFGRQDNILKEALKAVQKNYDVCVIDNPPDSNIPVLNGLEVMDDVIAVTLPNKFSLQGIAQLEQEIKNYNAILKLKIEIRGVLVNQFTSTESCYEILREIRGKGYKIFPYIRGGKPAQNWLDIHKYKLINCDISESRGRLAINSLTEKFDNPQREAEQWFCQETPAFYKKNLRRSKKIERRRTKRIEGGAVRDSRLIGAL